MEMEHVSVLRSECVKYLNIRPDGVYVDGTLGMGGHSEAIAEKLTTGRLIGIDRDARAIDFAGRRLQRFGKRVTLVRGNFDELSAMLDRYIGSSWMHSGRRPAITSLPT